MAKWPSVSLTPRQQEILKYIEDYWSKNGHAPSLRDAADFFDVQPNSIRSVFLLLKKAGAITWTPNRARTARPVSHG